MVAGIISSVIASIVTAIAVWMYRSAQLGGLQRLVVLPPNGEQLNTRFYTYFIRQIGRAKAEIIVTGEGFGYKGARGKQHADDYLEATRSALGDITRIQPARPFHPLWAKGLKELVRTFPDKFHLLEDSTVRIASTGVFIHADK
jgi:hypothetical protein